MACGSFRQVAGQGLAQLRHRGAEAIFAEGMDRAIGAEGVDELLKRKPAAAGPLAEMQTAA